MGCHFQSCFVRLINLSLYLKEDTNYLLLRKSSFQHLGAESGLIFLHGSGTLTFTLSLHCIQTTRRFQIANYHHKKNHPGEENAAENPNLHKSDYQNSSMNLSNGEQPNPFSGGYLVQALRERHQVKTHHYLNTGHLSQEEGNQNQPEKIHPNQMDGKNGINLPLKKMARNRHQSSQDTRDPDDSQQNTP